MAYELNGFRSGVLVAGADLSTKQYTAVTLNSSGLVVACSVLGEKVLGILANKPTLGQVCEIVHTGFTPVVASAAFAVNAKLMTAATGKIATAATTGSTIIGFAVEVANAGDEIVTAYVNCGAGVV